MTTEEQDALVGRLVRERKEAHAEVSRLVVKAEQIAKDTRMMSDALRYRSECASRAGSLVTSAATHWKEAEAEDAPMNTAHWQWRTPDEIRAMDEELTAAVARYVDLLRQSRRLGV